MRPRERGVALVIVLAVAVLLESFAALAVSATLARLRLAGDERLAIESQLIVASVLAEARVGHIADLAALPDNGRRDFGSIVRADGWSTDVTVTRTGAMLLVVATARRRGADGSLLASRHATLLLAHDLADTVRVLRHRPRF